MPIKNQFLFFFFGMVCTAVSVATNPLTEKKYLKEYYTNRTIKAKGWELGTDKTDYWVFYHPNGKIASKGHFSNNTKQGYWYCFSEEGVLVMEGHYALGIAEDWWIFHDIATQTEKRFQYKNNKKHGFALIYNKGRLTQAEK